jgi:amino-acid N-acetyltransferase
LLERSGLPLEGVSVRLVTLVARDAGAGVIGCAALEEFASGALLRSVAVDPQLRGSGLGARLTRAAMTLAAARGHQQLFLLTTTAAGFFPRFGFTPVDRADVPDDVRGSVEFVSACPATALVMRARLSADGSGRSDGPGQSAAPQQLA